MQVALWVMLALGALACFSAVYVAMRLLLREGAAVSERSLQLERLYLLVAMRLGALAQSKWAGRARAASYRMHPGDPDAHLVLIGRQVVLGAVGVAGMLAAAAASGDSRLVVLALPIGMTLSYMPVREQERALETRDRQVARSFPWCIAIMNMALRSGASFIQALEAYVLSNERSPLRAEIVVLVTELESGYSTPVALVRFRERCPVEEAAAFTQALLNADRLGTPVTVAMASLATDVREQALSRGHANAKIAETKLIPLVVGLMALVLLVMLAPAFSSMSNV